MNEDQLLPIYNNRLNYGGVVNQGYSLVALRLAGIDLVKSEPLSILDLGCGTGTFSRVAATYGHSVLGIDYSEERVRIARSLGGRFLCSKLLDFLFNVNQEAVWDLVTMFDVLEHVDEPSFTVRIARQVTSQVIAVVPLNHPADTHLRVWTSPDDSTDDLGGSQAGLVSIAAREWAVIHWAGSVSSPAA